MSDLTGQTIKHFKLEKRLGEGGMGTVYKAQDTVLERPVAIKLMHPHYAVQPEFRERLKQEARAAAQLEHPSIVRIYETGEGEMGLYIVMEYVSGGSLRAHMRRLQKNNKALNLENSLQIGIQIAEALDYAHREGMVHRDVKPGNIILRPARPQNEGEEDVPLRAILTDFGLVKVAQEDRVRTQTGLTMGTPAYMSPEQCQGLPLDGRSDLYSLGVVLYELVTNRPSFDFRTLSEALTYHIRGDMPEWPSRYRPEIPPLLDKIIMRLLEKEPDDRYPDGQALARELETVLSAIANEPTRYMMPTGETDRLMAQAPQQVMPGYFVLIEGKDRSTSHLPLDKPIISVGRGADNDIVLVSASMSRKHFRFQATENGWAVVDNGGLNGTTVNGRRIRPNELVPLTTDSVIEIAGYTLTLQHERYSQSARGRISKRYERPEDGLEVEPGQMTQFTQPLAATGQSIPPGALSQQTGVSMPLPKDPLTLYLTRERLPVEPGQATTLGIEVVNHTAVDDRVSIRIHGLPSNWLTLPDQFVDLRGNDRAQFKVTIRPPKRPDTAVGSQRFRVEVISQRIPDIDLAETATVLVGEFYAFEAQLKTTEIRPPDIATVTISNRGNVSNAFKVDFPTDERTLRFNDEVDPVRIAPGQAVDIPIPIGGPLKLFGEPYIYDYDLRVISKTGEQRMLSGGARLGGTVPPTLGLNLAYLVAVIGLLACGVFAFRNALPLGGGGLGPIAGLIGIQPTETPFGLGPTLTPGAVETIGTTPIIPDSALTGTAVAAILTQGPPTATIDPNSADSDGDGLSNAQEIGILGTDPNNPDTDGDGLTDGQEVEIPTEPLIVDTDSDGLSDFAEVINHRTNPRNPDTDGDGLTDKAEIDAGTDPLTGVVPTSTPQPTVAPSATPLTPTAVPSATAEQPTATAEPSVTPSVTPITPTPTLLPSETPPPTSTSTLAPTATQTTVAETPTSDAGEVTPTTETTTVVGSGGPLSLSCVSTPPTIDGVLTPGEWPAVLDVMRSQTAPSERFSEIYVAKDSTNLYLAMAVTGQSADPNQAIRFMIDTTNDGGDPDLSDRFIQVARDGDGEFRIGSGNNADIKFWEDFPAESQPVWTFATSEIAQDGVWVTEISISLADQLQILSSPFALGARVSITTVDDGDQLAWPEGITSINANNWADVQNVACPTN